MNPNKKKVLELVPAIRLIKSVHALKSGSFVPFDPVIRN